MVNIEERIQRFLCLKDTGSVHFTAYKLEGINQGIPDILKLKLGKLLHWNRLENIRRISLNKITIFVVVKCSKKSRMSLDRSLHDFTELFCFYHLLIKLHKREQIIHGRIRSIELIVDHVQLLSCKKMRAFHGKCIKLIGVTLFIVKLILIELSNFLRSSSSEYHARIQSRKDFLTCCNKLDRCQGISTHLVKVVIYAHTG